MKAMTLGLVLGLSLGLGACGSDDEDPGSNTGPVASFDRDPDANGGDAAAAQGVLELVNGCLQVRDDREGEDTVNYPAFAAGTFTWDADSETLTVDGSSVTVGDHVLLGGSGGGNRDDGISAPAGCDEADNFFIVAPDSVGPLPPDSAS